MSYNTIRDCLDYNAEQEELGIQLKYNPIECPEDVWPLDVDENGNRSCPICGRFWSK